MRTVIAVLAAVGAMAIPATAAAQLPGNGCGVGQGVSFTAHAVRDFLGFGLGRAFHEFGGNPAFGIPGEPGTGIKAAHEEVKALC